jgi:peptidyl-prolyl cis-trans isomerase A (cyclophilin A)
MKISTLKVAAAVFAFAFASSIGSAQTGTQSTTPAKKPATSTSTAAKKPAAPVGPGYDKLLLTPAALKAVAPDDYSVKFTTTKGDFTVQVTRAWAPLGADRFYNLAKHHFFDNTSFFRVIPGFVAQFGISAYPAVAKVWDDAKIKDDPVIRHNTPGTLVFATAGPNTRTTQFFINYRDNSGSLDPQGFSPFGEVTDGLDVVEKLNGSYGGNLDQEKITAGGKDYIAKNYPEMDLVKSTVVIEAAKPAPAKPAPKSTTPKPTPKPATTPKS